MKTRNKLNRYFVALLIIIGTHLYLLKKLIFFPYPELFIYSYLTSQGLLPYKQILDQHFPGLMFFPINLSSLGMVTPQIARVWHLGIVVLTHVSIYLVAKKLFVSRKWALLANVIYLVWQPFYEGYVFWIDTFVPLFLLSAFYFLLGEEKKIPPAKLFFSGFFLGLGLVFKQVVLPLIVFLGLLLFFRFENKKRFAPFALGVMIPPALMLCYIYSIGAWQDFLFWTVTFNLTTFAQMGRKYPSASLLFKTLPLFGLALVTCLCFLKSKKRRTMLILGTFFVSSLFFAYARFDFIHLQPALPFAVLIIVYLLQKLSKHFLVIFLFIYLLATAFLQFPFYKALTGSETRFFGDFEMSLSNKVSEYAKKGDSVFALGTTPHIYQLTQTLPPGKVFVFHFPWFMVEAEDRILAGIINDPPTVVVRDQNASVSNILLISYMSQIDNYINENYHTVDMVGGTEILLPK